MKRRAFVGASVIAIGTITLLKAELFVFQSKDYHYVGIGRDASNILDEVIKQKPHARITKAIGIDADYKASSKQKRIVYSGEPIEPILNSLLTNSTTPLLIVYCLGGASNADAAVSFIEELNQEKRFFKLIVQFPYSFEGKRRNEQAVVIADRLAKLTSFRCIHANQPRKDSKNRTLGNLFHEANQQMYQLVKEA